MPNIAIDLLTEAQVLEQLENSATIKQRVQAAHSLQQRRHNKSNSLLNNAEIKTFCALNKECKTLVKKATAILQLSARSFYRTLKVARTIADLAGSTNIEAIHLTEALGFRSKLNTNK